MVHSNCGLNGVQCMFLFGTEWNRLAARASQCHPLFGCGWIGLWMVSVSTHLLDIATASEVPDFMLASAQHLSYNLSKPMLQQHCHTMLQQIIRRMFSHILQDLKLHQGYTERRQQMGRVPGEQELLWFTQFHPVPGQSSIDKFN